MLVVRVKRNRNDEPAENICVVADQNPTKKRSIVGGLTEQLQGLSSNTVRKDVNTASGNHVLLTRVKTVDYHKNRTTLDDQTVNLIGERKFKRQFSDITTSATDIDSKSNGTTVPPAPAKVMVIRNRKTIAITSENDHGTEDETNVIVLDMNQIETQKILPTPTMTTEVISDPKKSTPVKVLDPATRQLERGIKTAIERGKFDDLNVAIIQGGRVEHQMTPQQGGHTALMAATMHCNLSLVRRLLTSNVDVNARNSEGKSAFDLLKPQNQRNKNDHVEIKLLLQAAITKAYIAEQKHLALVRQYRKDMGDDCVASDLLLNLDKNSTAGCNYVVDIYCVQQDSVMDVDVESSDVTEGDVQSESASLMKAPINTNQVDTSMYSIVQVEGLKISGSGEVELIFDDCDDDDNSDLGADEDPDSNDERFEGNDYPDEEEDDIHSDGEEGENSDDDNDNQDVDSDDENHHIIRQNTARNSKSSVKSYRNVALPSSFKNRAMFGKVENGDYVGSNVRFGDSGSYSHVHTPTTFDGRKQHQYSTDRLPGLNSSNFEAVDDQGDEGDLSADGDDMSGDEDCYPDLNEVDRRFNEMRGEPSSSTLEPECDLSAYRINAPFADEDEIVDAGENSDYDLNDVSDGGEA